MYLSLSSYNITVYKWPPLFVGTSVLTNDSPKYFRLLRFVSKQFQYCMNARMLEPQISKVNCSEKYQDYFLVIFLEILNTRYSWTIMSDRRHRQNICVPWNICKVTSTFYRTARNKFTENFAYCLFIKHA